jgi:hypothetical protein
MPPKTSFASTSFVTWTGLASWATEATAMPIPTRTSLSWASTPRSVNGYPKSHAATNSHRPHTSVPTAVPRNSHAERSEGISGLMGTRTPPGCCWERNGLFSLFTMLPSGRGGADRRRRSQSVPPAISNWLLTSTTPGVSQASSPAARLARQDETLPPRTTTRCATSTLM